MVTPQAGRRFFIKASVVPSLASAVLRLSYGRTRLLNALGPKEAAIAFPMSIGIYAQARLIVMMHNL